MDSPLPRFLTECRVGGLEESPLVLICRRKVERELGGGSREPAVDVSEVHRHARGRVGHCPWLFDVNVGLVQDRIDAVGRDEHRATWH